MSCEGPLVNGCLEHPQSVLYLVLYLVDMVDYHKDLLTSMCPQICNQALLSVHLSLFLVDMGKCVDDQQHNVVHAQVDISICWMYMNSSSYF